MTLLLGYEGTHHEKYFGQDCGEPGEGVSSCTPYSVDLVQNHQGMSVITLDQGKDLLKYGRNTLTNLILQIYNLGRTPMRSPLGVFLGLHSFYNFKMFTSRSFYLSGVKLYFEPTH